MSSSLDCTDIGDADVAPDLRFVDVYINCNL